MREVSRNIHKAKKVHQCNFCLEYIKPGEKYERSFFVDGGDSHQWKTHISCQLLAEKLRWFDDGPINEEDFQEFVNNTFMRITGRKDYSRRTYWVRLEYLKTINNIPNERP